jgi:hypothetical protein
MCVGSLTAAVVPEIDHVTGTPERSVPAAFFRVTETGEVPASTPSPVEIATGVITGFATPRASVSFDVIKRVEIPRVASAVYVITAGAVADTVDVKSRVSVMFVVEVEASLYDKVAFPFASVTRVVNVTRPALREVDERDGVTTAPANAVPY